MRATKSDHPSLIIVFAGRICHFVGFIVLRLLYIQIEQYQNHNLCQKTLVNASILIYKNIHTFKVVFA